jgi:ABC-type sulfate transport system substrate-binding protein
MRGERGARRSGCERPGDQGVSVITANPKTSGGARWGYLAACGFALKQPGGNDAKAKEFIAKPSDTGWG